MKKTNKTANGTSFHDTTITTTPKILKALLGEPDIEENDGSDKVNMEWVRETDTGYVFTVYDWKEYRPLRDNDMVEWHIGGNNKKITDRAAREIQQAMEDLKTQLK